MGIETDIAADWHAALAALAWQVELGVADVIGETPLDRYDLPEPIKPPPPAVAPPAPAPMRTPMIAVPTSDMAIAAATDSAARAGSLDDLRQALLGFEHCDLKRGARNLVFADGNPAARVLVLGEAPGVEEDREGRPFLGKHGMLLDRMFAAIGLTRQNPDPAAAFYLTNVMPWRVPHGRDLSPEEIDMMRPFVERHITLADPDVIVVLGNTPMQCLLRSTGIGRQRGSWATALGRPVLPLLHPGYLIKSPESKRETWADLLSLQAKLRN